MELGKISALSEQAKIGIVVQMLGIAAAAFFLRETDAVYSVYLLCGFFGIFTLIYNSYYGFSCSCKRKRKLFCFFSIIFSFCVLLANYSLFFPFVTSKGVDAFFPLLKAFITGSGCFFTSWNIFTALDFCVGNKERDQNTQGISPLALWGIFFAVFSGIDLVVLFCANYPGNLSPDSINQMKQILMGAYSNHHPFWHTMLIKVCVKIGLKLFGEINAAVACYSVFQIIFVSASFSFCIATFYQMGIPKRWWMLSAAFFALMPYHVEYSMTMWKDVPFACAVLVFLTGLLRYFEGMGKRRWINWLVLILGGIGICLWRSNGWLAFAGTALLFAFVFGKRHKKLTICFFAILLGTYVLIHPVLSQLNIKQPDPIESLSIPVQQISRVVADGKELDSVETELLSKLMDLERVPEEYLPYISDPIKNLVRETGDQNYLVSHKGDYMQLWLSLGIKYPTEYLKAWIDQTKGYWNGGYDYWILFPIVSINSLKIKQLAFFPRFLAAKNTLFSILMDIPILRSFSSIGLATWLILGCGAISLANKRWKQAFLSVPLFMIIATLLVAAPVFSEFRYAYALFTSMPLILCATFHEKEDIDSDGKNCGFDSLL